MSKSLHDLELNFFGRSSALEIAWDEEKSQTNWAYLENRVGIPKLKFPAVVVRCTRLLQCTGEAVSVTSLSAGPRHQRTGACSGAHAMPTSVKLQLKPTVDFLQTLSLAKVELGRMLTTCPNLLQYSLDNRFRPNINFFNSIRIQGSAVRELVIFFPNTLIREAGYYSSPSWSTCGAWVSPLMLTMGRPLSELVEFPAFYGYNLNKTIAPRHRRLGKQASACTLVAMLACSDPKFNERFGIVCA
uniref:Uncharacterized protein n=1 Tax=Physcomitrium patens TaxID=3218 RepID=A0A2K1II22_PHYPA|nr:hypothetical protein PHYPA_027618 [Physcomitrium patens]